MCMGPGWRAWRRAALATLGLMSGGLFRLREARVPVAGIASRLGRHRSTMYHELARNRFRDPDATRDRRRDMSGYYPVTAQNHALARRRRLARLARHGDLLAQVVDRLRAGCWSPQEIAGRLRLDEASGADREAVGRLCHKTIYRHVHGPEGCTDQRHLCLSRARRRRATQHGRKPRGHRIPQKRGIACRPAEVATRTSFGH